MTDVFRYRVKATLDRLLATGLLLVLAPVFLLIALLIKLNDGGPVFFHSIVWEKMESCSEFGSSERCL